MQRSNKVGQDVSLTPGVGTSVFSLSIRSVVFSPSARGYLLPMSIQYLLLSALC